MILSHQQLAGASREKKATEVKGSQTSKQSGQWFFFQDLHSALRTQTATSQPATCCGPPDLTEEPIGAYQLSRGKSAPGAHRKEQETRRRRLRLSVRCDASCFHGVASRLATVRGEMSHLRQKQAARSHRKKIRGAASLRLSARPECAFPLFGVSAPLDKKKKKERLVGKQSVLKFKSSA